MDIREERKSLIKSAEKYIEAGQYGDIQLIKDVFHNHVTIFGYFEGEFLGGPFQLLYDLMEMTSSYAGKPVPDILVPL